MRDPMLVAWITLASCGPQSDDDGATCPADSDADCWHEFARTCESRVDEQSCIGTEGVPLEGGGTNLTCAWVEPTRWTRVGDLCDGASEPPRCVAGLYVGDGGQGCDAHWDRADEGEGAVIAVSDRCHGPYEWGVCSYDDDAPPECGCAGE